MKRKLNCLNRAPNTVSGEYQDVLIIWLIKIPTVKQRDDSIMFWGVSQLQEQGN